MDEKSIMMPAIALRGTTILPGMVVHFDIGRAKSKRAAEKALWGDRQVFLVTQKNNDIVDPGFEDLYGMGTLAEVKQVLKTPGEVYRVLVEGRQRARLLELSEDTGILRCVVEPVEEKKENLPDGLEEAMNRGLRELFTEYISAGAKMGKEIAQQLLREESLPVLLREIAGKIPISSRQRQTILDAVTLEGQYEALGSILSYETGVLLMQREIQGKVKVRIDKNQKEYLMREQIKVIKEELGEDDILSEADAFREKLSALETDGETRAKIEREISRFSRMNQSSPDSANQRAYLETLFEIPFGKHTQDNNDLKNAWRVLEKEHYGLKEVKERVMEFLAVRQLTEKGRAPILCLVGPPGTGKTSIARSLAEALGKKYVRICLGGVYDEAEIRGHRRTYIGALPGNIAAGLRQAGYMNPLMLLDEIDKTGKDYKGDISSALLEVLDPEQNSHFRDNYLEVPLDLSEVLFLATANDTATIPRPLLDRMELIRIPGYSENEKLHIAKEHLIPKQKKENGIREDLLSISDAALSRIIALYTKEAGVRGLERQIGRICRKCARLLLEEGKGKTKVTVKNLSDFLGKPVYHHLMANKKDEVGIARGLAWTQAGGDTLEIEVNVMPGKGEILMTGQLGDVMKESAQAGISYIRSVADRYGVEQAFFKENDLHVHIPEGAVPKDGPSAGITMATAMLSAIADIPVRADIAMTGEITLRGRVLPIGGLKEKLLAAKYAKIKEVLVPMDNKPDIEEMDAEITDGLKITFVEQMEEVIQHALAGDRGRFPAEGSGLPD